MKNNCFNFQSKVTTDIHSDILSGMEGATYEIYYYSTTKYETRLQKY